MSLHNQNVLGNDITTGEIVNSAVTTAKIADDAVTTAKILNANVTAAKLATDAVETAKIKNANVTIDKVPQTGRAALRFLRVNAGNTELEFTTGGASAADQITIEGQTLTLQEWLLL